MSGKTVIGKLFATWCGHCQSLEEPWNKMKTIVGEKVEFVEIESENLENELKTLNAKHKTDVKMQGGYPTLFKIKGTKVSYYNGERTQEELVKWASPKSGGKSKKRKQRKGKRTRRQ
jgi:thiol-disulfide isomerase/thioredoxin